MKKTLAIALATLFTSSLAIAETEVTGKFTQESAVFTKSGSNIGDTTKHLFKSEYKVQVFFDGDVGKESTFHVEVQVVIDNKMADDYDSAEPYTQREPLREAYIDTETGDWSIRAGKQQVVWGTADGIKLLDLINPTDYSEMVQNTPEDSRITTWMINTEKEFDNGGNFQIILSQPKENIFAGLNRDIDTSVRSNDLANATAQGIPDIVYSGTNQGHPFILKGVDTITGQRNGFLNIAPDLGSVAAGFGANFLPLGTPNSFAGLNPAANPLATLFTVGGFTSGATLAELSTQLTNLGSPIGFDEMNFGLSIAGLACQNPNYTGGGSPGAAQCANLVSTIPATIQTAVTAIFNEVGGQFTGAQVLDTFGNGYDSNLSSYSANDGDNSAFEYMKLASFATFDAFVNARSQYVYNMPDDTDVNFAFRWKNSTNKGLNYSLNYSYNYDTNPVINLSWRNDAGEVLKKDFVTTLNVANTGATGYHLALTDAADIAYGGSSNNSAILTFEQTLERAHNIGGSLDYALDTKVLGAVVLRAEALYQKDVYSPIIDKSRLSFGDLTDALKMIPGDRFKYVLGADITVMTNMLISAQFIQDRNLDYVNGNGALNTECRTSVAGAIAQGVPNLNADEVCVRYTADFSSMHLTNGLQKAEKNKNFVSLFLSKPFGESQQHRWNNIIIFEDQDTGGYWNRLDMEYSINDDTQLTAEYNRYWGEENSQFGQLKNSSNVQIGLKYDF